MGGSWLARRNVGDFDNIEDWMAQRNADVALRPDAEAAGREAWDQATRSGQGLSAAQPSDVVAIGAGALNQGAAATVAPDLRSAEPVGIDDPVQVGRLPSPDAAHPDLASPGYGLANARPGDSISWLLGTSSPAAIGRFASLNGMDGRDSTLYAGHSYAVPTRFGDASPDEIATGNRMLRGDNARLAALRPQLASDPETTGRFATLINAGINPWTGAYSAHGPNIDKSVRPPAANTIGSPPAPTTWLDRSGTAKALAGEAALRVGQVAGLARGGWHLAGDAGFAARLFDPFDGFFSPPGETAWDQVIDAGGRVVGYAKKAISDPSAVANDIGGLANRANIDLNLNATPMADTFPGELRRSFHIGANQGEAAFDVGSFFLGGEFAKGLSLTRAVEAADATKYAELGLSPKVIDYLKTPYHGMGHHNVARRFTFQKPMDRVILPSWVPDRPLPKWLSDDAINLSKPEGITRGQFYAYHYRVDPKFHGGPLQADAGGGWSGKKLGLKKYGLPERLWYGAPDALRAGVGEAVAGGAAADIFQNDWDRP